MVVVIVKWYIKKGKNQDFIEIWKSMNPASFDGLFREFLNEPETFDPEKANKFLTLDAVNPYYTTFINVGIWRTLDDFDKAIGSLIPQRTPNEKKPGWDFYEVFEFEFKMRERIVLDGKMNRAGLWKELPESLNQKDIEEMERR
jgi:hypothetical protein